MARTGAAGRSGTPHGTTAADGTIEVSPKGDEPGFIRVEDPKTLLIPERVGNNLAFGLSNILATGKIAHSFATDLALVDGARLTAVGSRRLESAQVFAVIMPNLEGGSGPAREASTRRFV